VSFLLLSIVVPCYEEQANLKKFYDEVISIAEKEKYDFQIILINDGPL
jgi:glycosyltransferase involved in cell wall biosynthesis